MLLTMLKAKIHRAVVTQCDLDYEGSITLPPSMMRAVDILEHEQVDVVNINNGARFSTYAIEGPDDTTYCLNGAAARLAQPGDRVIVMSYATMEERKAREFRPRVVVLDEENRVVEEKR